MRQALRAVISALFVFALAGAAGADHEDCTRDLNNDGQVDAKDMKIIDDAMGSREGRPPYDERADLDHDGFVTSSDRAVYSRCQQ